ncbi:glycosyltransferase [Kordiimonas gwangyangensis]|uniref:glycosyltransferase n=1 Tax=Kordiimonas gwangyangensis TaxID=288022 RepID=UPI0003604623|nr:glycosyltransferase [Kordiimonas gwangyangensis]
MQRPLENNQDSQGFQFDPQDDMFLARTSPALDASLHIYHGNWYGIASASAALPGHKLRINAEKLTADDAQAIAAQIGRHGIKRVCFQGYSQAADTLLTGLRQHLGDEIGFFAVSHVTSTQFQAPFEVRMQAALLKRLRAGDLRGIASVKPHFHHVVPATWQPTIINFCPNIECTADAEAGRVFIPVENHWRKGLYTNLIAALRTAEVRAVCTVNQASHLDEIEDLSRVEVCGFLDRDAMAREMARASAVMNVSLAECQPMTQLEAFALGRPCLTGPLGLDEFARDPITEFCTVGLVDTPNEIIARLGDILRLSARDPEALAGMIAEHVTKRNALAATRYTEFLEL